jgi:hypothetical protein
MNDPNREDMWRVVQYAEEHAPKEVRIELVMALGYLGVEESNLAATPGEVEACRERVRTAITALNMPATEDDDEREPLYGGDGEAYDG